MTMDRKDFLKGASAATVLAMFGLSLESCSGDDSPTPNNNTGGGGSLRVTFELTSAPYDELANNGGWLLHPSEDILMVNVGGTISAFSSRCTHTGCTRDWTFPNNNFRCNCHGSIFDTFGSVVSGPASSSLLGMNVTREGNTVTIG